MPPLEDSAKSPSTGSIQRPIQLIDPMPQEDAAFLQTSADTLLNKINTLRCGEPCALNPEASPFTPLSSSNSTKDHCLVVTTAEVHSPPKEVMLNTFDEEPQPNIVSQKDDSSFTTD